jgi:hypothetical protein
MMLHLLNKNQATSRNNMACLFFIPIEKISLKYSSDIQILLLK